MRRNALAQAVEALLGQLPAQPEPVALPWPVQHRVSPVTGRVVRASFRGAADVVQFLDLEGRTKQVKSDEFFKLYGGTEFAMLRYGAA